MPIAISLLETTGSGRSLTSKVHYCILPSRECVVEVGEGGRGRGGIGVEEGGGIEVGTD